MCSNTQAKDRAVSFHRIPRDIPRRSTWLEVFGMSELDIKPSSRVCCRHFPDGDVRKIPSMTLGKSDLIPSTTLG